MTEERKQTKEKRKRKKYENIREIKTTTTTTMTTTTTTTTDRSTETWQKHTAHSHCIMLIEMGLSVLNCSEQSARGMQEKHEQTEREI